MPSLLRCLLVVLLALSLPLQGVAAVVRLHCAPVQQPHQPPHAAAAARATDHAAHHAHHADSRSAHTASSPEAPAGSSHGCSACAVCCTAMAAPSSLPLLPVAAADPTAAPPPALVAATFLTSGPDRPPRTRAA